MTMVPRYYYALTTLTTLSTERPHVGHRLKWPDASSAHSLLTGCPSSKILPARSFGGHRIKSQIFHRVFPPTHPSPALFPPPPHLIHASLHPRQPSSPHCAQSICPTPHTPMCFWIRSFRSTHTAHAHPCTPAALRDALPTSAKCTSHSKSTQRQSDFLFSRMSTCYLSSQHTQTRLSSTNL